MIHSTIEFSKNSSLTLYCPENFDSFSKGRKRSFILICPGGGYGHLSDREGEGVALKFVSLGFAAGVLKYSLAPMEFGAALADLAEAVSFVRKNAQEFNVDEKRICVAGFSAGAHLAASLGTVWHKGFEFKSKKFTSEEIRPNFLLLSYPVITADEEFSHKGSIENVLGTDFNSLSEEEKQARKKIVSLEKQVTEKFPPVFMWHTLEDESVPLENSLKFAAALRNAGVEFEYHIFARGKHGLALATKETSAPDGSNVEKECAVWPELFMNWKKGLRIKD